LRLRPRFQARYNLFEETQINMRGRVAMSKQYIPVATNKTVYFEPQTKEEMDGMIEKMKLGDMLFNKWVFSRGMWYTMGLNDKNDPTTKCLFPNIVMKERLPSLSRWGLARMDFLKNNQPFVAAQFGTVGLHKHCLEIEEQAKQRKRNMMSVIRKDPANKVTEKDKAADPIAWVGRMNNFQAQVHEVIYNDLIFSK
jgi:hypothetical protein